MPHESQENDTRSIADRLSKAAGVTASDSQDNGNASQPETTPEQTKKEAEKDTEEAAHQRNEKVSAHLADKRKKEKRFRKHFGERGDERRSGLRISEDGAYEWSAIDYEHDEGVVLFRFDRSGDDIQREKRTTPLAKLIELNPDPTEHSRLRELHVGNSTADKQDANTDTSSVVDEDHEDKDESPDEASNESEVDEQQISQIAHKVGLNSDLENKLKQMVENAPHEYSREMTRNAAEGLLEHQQATAEIQKPEEPPSLKENKKEGADKSKQVHEKTRAKRAIEQIAKEGGPLSEEDAQQIRKADTEEMQAHYQKTRTQQTAKQSESADTRESVGIAERVGKSKQSEKKDTATGADNDVPTLDEQLKEAEESHAQHKAHTKETEKQTTDEQVSTQMQFFETGIRVLEYIRDLYHDKNDLANQESQKLAAIQEEIAAYKDFQTQLEADEPLDKDELTRRVAGLNKAANAHPRLRENRPELIQHLQDAEAALAIEI